MDNCIIQLEVNHCPKSGCSGPSVTNVGVFKNEDHAIRFMPTDKDVIKIYKASNVKKNILPIALWALPGSK